MSGKSAIVVYGAAGYTGQLVAAELSRRGYVPILAGRTRDGLERTARTLQGDSKIVVAAVNDHSALSSMLEGVRAIVNCAGPFSVTSGPLASVAVASRVHYFDTNAVEQIAAKKLFDGVSADAREAHVAVIPGLATYGALSDLMSHVASGEVSGAEGITVGYFVEGWIPTKGSQETAIKSQSLPRILFENGVFSERVVETAISEFEFDAPIGVKKVIAQYPGIEVVTIPRHVDVKHIEVNMALATMQEFRGADPKWAAAVDGDTRAKTKFSIVVEAKGAGGRTRVVASGRDIYGITAPIIVNGLEEILSAKTAVAGVLSSSEAFHPASFLNALNWHDFSWSDPTQSQLVQGGGGQATLDQPSNR